jgi:hypothetical protein
MRPWIDDPRAAVARVDDDEEQRRGHVLAAEECRGGKWGSPRVARG